MEAKNLNWHAVGVGPLLIEAKKTAKNQVQFHGAIINMEDVWPDVDLLCITSTHEGLPLVLLEAMSHGIPVVSFDVGSIRSIIPYGEYVIEPSGLKQMHDSILSHFSKSQKYREKIAEHSRQQIQKQFSSTLISSQIEAVYNRCIHNDQ
jgi:glycosyltransferase involved in cell wall biosynthesis